MTERTALIDDPQRLRPETEWSETVWAWTGEEALLDHTTKPRLCSAALLPFQNARPDWDGFLRALQWQFDAAERYGVELVPVLNADTGYIFELDNAMYAEVLRRFRAAYPQRKFIAGVTARSGVGEGSTIADDYRPLLDIAQSHANCEILLMTSPRLNALEPEPRRDAYFAIAEHLVRPTLVHALEPAFVPWATPYKPWLLWQLANHPKFLGGKISTLDEPHFLYWAAMTQSLGLDFVPHSGDDFGIATAIKMGRPLLIGAASSAAPLVCAALDMWLDESSPRKRFRTGVGGFDTRVYKLFETIQSLEDQVFRFNERLGASAYKHSTAHVLHQLGLIAAPEPHPACRDVRGLEEAARMEEALRRVRRIAERLVIPGFSTIP